MSSVIANSGILGQYEHAQGAEKKTMTDKDTFLTLLITQLTHQDPLNPVEDTEFLAQLAQFNSVEQLQNLNDTVDKMSNVVAQSQVTDAVGLMGAAVEAKGDQVSLIHAEKEGEADYCTPLIANLPRAASEVYVNVYATTESGDIGTLVYSTTMGAKNAGDLTVQWDGTSNNGTKMPQGTYIVNVSAVDQNGSKMLIDSRSSGVVFGVKTEADGNHKLYLNDGRTVNYHDVTTITFVPSGEGGASGDSNTDGEGGGSDENNTDSENDGSDDNTTDGESDGTDNVDNNNATE